MDCGWTTDRSRSQLQKHRRTEHPRAVPAGAGFGAIRIPDLPALEEAMVEVQGPAQATQLDELGDELLGYLDHLHGDLRAILSHLGIARPECAHVAPEYEEP
jgi:hypothetical protein